MYLQLTELDTFRMLEELLLSAIQDFEFPRVNLNDYELFGIVDEKTYNGAESQHEDVQAIVYEEGIFNTYLTQEQINILAVYMIVHWLSQQLASVENTRMKYSGNDFKFTSQANHMQKLLQLKKDYERRGFHLQRLYKRRLSNENGIMKSTLHLLRGTKPVWTQDDIDRIKQGYSDRERDRDTIFIHDGGSSFIQS